MIAMAITIINIIFAGFILYPFFFELLLYLMLFFSSCFFLSSFTNSKPKANVTVTPDTTNIVVKMLQSYILSNHVERRTAVVIYLAMVH